jgi:hypothetical protein
LAIKIGKDLEKEKEACKSSQKKFCPLYQKEIIDYIENNFVNVNKIQGL